MELGLTILTIAVYGLAIYQGLRERTALYVVALLAGQVGTLGSPIWQILYRFSYAPDLTPALTLFDNPLPRTVLVGGWLTVFPALLAIVLSRRRAWFTSYAAALLLFSAFLIYFIMLETLGTRARYWVYSGATISLDISTTLLAAIMHALVTLGMLAALQVTRHYTLGSLLVFLLPVPLVLGSVVHGLLGAPTFTVLLLRTYMPGLVTESWADTIGVVGTLLLLGWAVHLVASTLARQGVAQSPV
jgi:hypothetical protein